MRSRDKPATVRCPCSTRSTSIRVASPCLCRLAKIDVIRALDIRGNQSRDRSRLCPYDPVANRPNLAHQCLLIRSIECVCADRIRQGDPRPPVLTKVSGTDLAVPIAAFESSTNGGRLRGIHVTPAFITRHITRFGRQSVDRGDRVHAHPRRCVGHQAGEGGAYAQLRPSDRTCWAIRKRRPPQHPFRSSAVRGLAEAQLVASFTPIR